MSAIDFVIRTRMGTVERGSVGGNDEDFLIDAGSGNDISLNISQASLRGYDRAADDLLITLADGRVIVLEGYFENGPDGANRLFLSSEGILNEVSFVETENGALFAQYGPTETWGKWSPSDELIFVDDPQVLPEVPMAGADFDGEGEQVSMLATGLLGLGGLGLGTGAAAVGGAALLTQLGGGGGDTPIVPTVDNPDADLDIGGNDTPTVTVTGTATPGATVDVTIGDDTVTATTGDDGTWEVIFTGDDFPDDGDYDDVPVVVTDPDGTVTTLDGPSFEIDNTPPVLEVFSGTTSVGDLFNAEGYDGGVILSGTAEVGSTITIEIGSHTQTVIVGDDGGWSFTFDETVFPGGEYNTDITITAMDAFSNTTVITDTVTIDTVPHPITIDPVTPDNVINGEEADAGFVISGTSTAGAIVTVVFEDFSQDVLVAADGTWEVNVTADAFAGGEYSSTITVSTTDLAGNSSSVTSAVQIDTVNTVSLDNGPLTGDDLISAAEYDAGVTLTGTSQANTTIEVNIEGSTQTVVAGADGAWSVTFAGGSFASGSYATTAVIVSTDAAGNASTYSHNFTIDTEAMVTIDTSAVAGDGMVNAAEIGDTITVVGTGEVGASIQVSNSRGVWGTTTVAADGSWSIDMPAGGLDGGPGHSELGFTSTLTVTSTDLAGNVTTTSGSVQVDTNTTVAYMYDDADGVLNAAERADGVQMSGFAEANATVTVMVSGNVYTATADGAGDWALTIPASAIPTGETSVDVTVTATDLAGNTNTSDITIGVDTITHVDVSTANVEGDGVVNAAERADGIVLTGQTEPGNAVVVTLGSVSGNATVAADGSWTLGFPASALPMGESTVAVTAVATDAAGNTATATDTLDVDTLVRNFAISSTPGGADGVLNAAEADQGLTVTGSTEPGGSVSLTLDGVTVQANVAADGSWSATFAAGQLPRGERVVTLQATSTDAAGNTETLSQNVTIDTDAGILTISPDPVEGDDVVNFAEAADGVVLTGTSNPGEMVTVTLGGVSHVVQTDGAGTWTAAFAPGEIAPGTYTADITATITDSAGNTLTRTDSVEIDTEVVNFTTSADPVANDGTINANEAANGFTLTGTTEPGSSVTVTFEGTTVIATVDPDGSWTATFPGGSVPAGEYDGTATINTVDPAGNPATTTANLNVDTLVNELTDTSDILAGDGVINAIEAQQGVTLSGTVEAGSVVTVTLGGVAHVATVNPDGSWSVDIPSSDIPTGSVDAPLVVEATDQAGNTRTITDTISIDTDVPDSLSWLGYGRDGSGVDLVRTEITDDTVYLGQLTTSGGNADVVDVPLDAVTDIDAIGQSYMALDGSVADGTHLVLSTTDRAGNTSGALLVTDDPSTNTVQMSDSIAEALGDFQIDTIDLHFAEDAELTITESQIAALSDTTDSVVVKGGSDDSVTITGATLTGSTAADGETYDVYSLGDTTVLVDDDITINTGVV